MLHQLRLLLMDIRRRGPRTFSTERWTHVFVVHEHLKDFKWGLARPDSFGFRYFLGFLNLGLLLDALGSPDLLSILADSATVLVPQPFKFF